MFQQQQPESPFPVAGLVQLARGERMLLISGPEAVEASRDPDVRGDVLLRGYVPEAVGLQQRLPPVLVRELVVSMPPPPP